MQRNRFAVNLKPRNLFQQILQHRVIIEFEGLRVVNQRIGRDGDNGDLGRHRSAFEQLGVE